MLVQTEQISFFDDGVWRQLREVMNFSSIMGFLAIILASVNIFGGFVVSHRMLSMFKKKEKKKKK